MTKEELKKYIVDFKKSCVQKNMHRGYENAKYSWYTRIPRFICKDGFEFSAQCGYALYCNMYDSFDKMYGFDESDIVDFEVGFPSADEVLLKQYECDPDAIYSYVPIETIIEIISKHGGLNQETWSDHVKKDREQRIRGKM